jgi:hypothetical protein
MFSRLMPSQPEGQFRHHDTRRTGRLTCMSVTWARFCLVRAEAGRGAGRRCCRMPDGCGVVRHTALGAGHGLDGQAVVRQGVRGSPHPIG